MLSNNNSFIDDLFLKHDTTVASLLCGLGIEVKGQPFTASCILIEVYQETDGYE